MCAYACVYVCVPLSGVCSKGFLVFFKFLMKKFVPPRLEMTSVAMGSYRKAKGKKYIWSALSFRKMIVSGVKNGRNV